MKLYTWERWTLALILTGVGLLAGYVSVFHVATWTMDNSPPGTSIVAGLTNAAISELIPVAALIVYRICRRHDRSAGLAVFLIVAAGALSLTAQVAVAKASLSGWVVSAAPMAAFLLLTKLSLAILSPASDPALINQPTTVATNTPPAPRPSTSTAVGAIELSTTPPRVALAADAVDVQTTPEGQKFPPEPAPKAARVERVESKAAGRRQVRPRSLTSADKVQKALTDLGGKATTAEVAARARVSESTARRYLPKPPGRDASIRVSVGDHAVTA